LAALLEKKTHSGSELYWQVPSGSFAPE